MYAIYFENKNFGWNGILVEEFELNNHYYPSWIKENELIDYADKIVVFENKNRAMNYCKELNQRHTNGAKFRPLRLNDQIITKELI